MGCYEIHSDVQLSRFNGCLRARLGFVCVCVCRCVGGSGDDGISVECACYGESSNNNHDGRRKKE